CALSSAENALVVAAYHVLCAEDSARYSMKNFGVAATGFGRSWPRWPNGAACSLDGDRLLDCLFVCGMHRRQFVHLQNVHAEVADFAQRQPGKLRDGLANSMKNIIDRRNYVPSPDC